MRHNDLRLFFLRLASVAVPVPLAIAACGGVVDERNGQSGVEADDGAGGEATYGGDPGGGPPIYTGVGGYVGRGGAGGGATYGGDPGGGPPIYTGIRDAGGRPPTYYGSGGYTGTGGALMLPDAGPGGAFPILDAGPTYDGAWSDAQEEGDGGASLPPDAGFCNLPGCGRRPPGLEAAPRGIGRDVSVYFEQMARLEAASVPAFRRLGHELRSYGAPERLLRAARRAACDEVVHTRLARVLAERFGGRYTPPRIARNPQRSLEALALDNATEGGVRETFGAMMATWQGNAASDPIVRRILRRIAVDETRHAALAMRVAEWTDRQLEPAARRRVHDARRATAAEVMRELDWVPSAELVSLAGVPTRADAERLARAMTERLWA